MAFTRSEGQLLSVCFIFSTEWCEEWGFRAQRSRDCKCWIQASEERSDQKEFPQVNVGRHLAQEAAHGCDIL